MAHRIIDTLDDLHDMTRFMATLKLPITVEWVPGRDRTKDQNSLQWLWAGEVAYQTGDRTAVDVQDDWRVKHGVPILRADNPEFRAMYDACIKPLPYEMKKDALRVLGVKITSAMKVRQMVRYMDAVQQSCAEMGLHLTDPDPDLAIYQKRYRAKETT